MSGITYTSICMNNGLIILDALAPDDLQTGRRLYSDITDHTNAIGRSGYCTRYEVTSVSVLHACLAAVLFECKSGVLRPILHFECHGHPEKGMQIGSSKEYLTWSELQRIVGAFNKVTRNHCAVVVAACYGYALSRGLDVSKPCPFNYLIAPSEEMLAGAFADTMSVFYRTVASSGDLITGLKAFPSEMQLVVAGEWFYSNLGSYLINHYTQRERQQIAEEVVSRHVAAQPGLNRAQRRAQLKQVRKTAKQRVGDTRQMANHFATTFFHGSPPVGVDEFVEWVRAVKASKG